MQNVDRALIQTLTEILEHQSFVIGVVMLAVPTTQNIFVNPASNDFHVRTQYLCFFIYCFSSKDVGTSLEVFSALVCNKI